MIGNMESDEKTKIKTTKVPNSSNANNFNAKEIAKLKEVMEKFPNLEDSINRLLK